MFSLFIKNELFDIKFRPVVHLALTEYEILGYTQIYICTKRLSGKTTLVSSKAVQCVNNVIVEHSQIRYHLDHTEYIQNNKKQYYESNKEALRVKWGTGLKVRFHSL